MEDWAEIRRLHRAEGVPIKEIARRLGVARNTVRAALASDRAAEVRAGPAGSVADAFEPQVRALLAEWPRMPGPVIAQRIGWPYSEGPLKKLLARIRPEYVGIDPADRVVYEPGQIAQCDLWFPETPVPVTAGQARVLPVLVMTLGFSRFLSATMIPSRQAGDILSGMWLLISRLGRVPKTLVWDRESAIGGTGRVSVAAAAFAGTLATRIRLAPPRDPEFKGMVERNNGFFETSFLPGRDFASPRGLQHPARRLADRQGQHPHRPVDPGPPGGPAGGRPPAMTLLPPIDPPVGLTHRIRLGRDYYVRVDTNDYSVDPRVIGRFVDVTASPTRSKRSATAQLVARHDRCWARHGVGHRPCPRRDRRQMRLALAEQRRAQERAQQIGARQHTDGHAVALRALPDYDALFGVDFDPTPTGPTTTPTAAAAAEASNP